MENKLTLTDLINFAWSIRNLTYSEKELLISEKFQDVGNSAEKDYVTNVTRGILFKIATLNLLTRDQFIKALMAEKDSLKADVKTLFDRVVNNKKNGSKRKASKKGENEKYKKGSRRVKAVKRLYAESYDYGITCEEKNSLSTKYGDIFGGNLIKWKYSETPPIAYDQSRKYFVINPNGVIPKDVYLKILCSMNKKEINSNSN
ncbi:hypothetical protein GCM10023189_38040 [Nibrella saemangeumensis]|uniref:Uncharacterized protein n=1 Tax=Nibrella saemangeumensis TaxID=1084526 RepID=A0ABP8N657_9BACT